MAALVHSWPRYMYESYVYTYRIQQLDAVGLWGDTGMKPATVPVLSTTSILRNLRRRVVAATNNRSPESFTMVRYSAGFLRFGACDAARPRLWRGTHVWCELRCVSLQSAEQRLGAEANALEVEQGNR